MSERLTPLRVCERLIGPITLIAHICGVSDTAPHHWKRGSKLHGAGDIPSARHMARLLAHSDRLGLGLTPLHLIEGAEEAEVEAILAARQELRPTG
jgi:hypothetical protein